MLQSLGMKETVSCSSRHGCLHCVRTRSPEPRGSMVGLVYGTGAVTAAAARALMQSSVDSTDDNCCITSTYPPEEIQYTLGQNSATRQCSRVIFDEL